MKNVLILSSDTKIKKELTRTLKNKINLYFSKTISFESVQEQILNILPQLIVVDTNQSDWKTIHKICELNMNCVYIFVVDYSDLKFNFYDLDLNARFIQKSQTLKTLSKTILEVFEVLEKKQKVKFANAKSLVKEYIPTIRQHYLNLLLKTSYLKENDIKHKFRKFEIQLNNKYYQVAVIDITKNKKLSNFEELSILLITSVKSIFKLNSFSCYTFFDSNFLVNCIVGYNKPDLDSKVENYLINIKNEFKDNADINIGVGIGERVEKLEKLNHSYETSLKTLEQSYHNSKIIYYKNIKTEKLDKREDFINDTKNYIEKNISNSNLSLDTISDYVGLSKPYFCSQFKLFYKQSFSDYVKKLKIQIAIDLLTNTNKSIDHIAKQIGFSNTKYFYTFFKQSTGETPLKYRKSSKN